MAKTYKLDIRTTLKDRPRCEDIRLPAQAADVLRDVMAPHVLDPERWMQQVAREFKGQSPPWLTVVLPNDLPLAGYIAERRGVYRHAPVSCYAAHRAGRVSQDNPQVSMIFFRSAGVLRKMARGSGLLAPIQRIASALDPSTPHLLVADTPDDRLVRELAVDNAARFFDARDKVRPVSFCPPEAMPHSVSRLDYLALMEACSSGQVDAAERFAECVLRAAPEDATTWYALGMARFGVDRAGSAEALRRALELEPRLLAARQGLAQVLFRAGDYAAALAEYQIALAVDPHDEASWRHAAKAMLSLGDVPGALRCFEELQLLCGMDAAEWNLLAFGLVGEDRWPEAVNAFEQALLLEPGHAPRWNNYGYALAQTGRARMAVSVCRRAIELDPLYACSWDSLGVALLKSDRAPEAIVALERALQLRTPYPDALEHLGLALMKCGRIADAHRVLGVLAALDGPSADRLQAALAAGGGESAETAHDAA
jgi:tetratricopeptide (TPR) repeat protein